MSPLKLQHPVDQGGALAQLGGIIEDPLDFVRRQMRGNFPVAQDRQLGDEAAAYGGYDLDLNGENAALNVTGTIYAPTGSLKFNGSDTDVLSAQVICYDFLVNGSGSAFTINYEPDELFHLKGVGLVE